jgi:uncharacterized protein
MRSRDVTKCLNSADTFSSTPIGPIQGFRYTQPDLKTRAEILVAITQIDLAKKRTSGDPPLQ